MDVFVVLPSLQWKFFNCASGTTVRNLVDQFTLDLGISTVDFYVKHNGRVSSGEELLHPRGVYRFEPRLPGGKGGFGSMLRALGAQIEKTTNREACRDLSGRRLRDVNHEKEMAEWLKKQAEREAGKEQRRLERLQRKLAEPRHLFSDPDYEQQCHDLSERLEDSVLKGMQAASSDMVQADAGPSRKRPVATVATTTSASAQKTNKKKCLWTGMEDLVGSDENSESDSDDGDNISPSTSSSTSCSSTGPSAAAAAKPPSSSSTSSSFLTSATGRPDQPNFQKATSGSSSSSSCSASSSPERAGSGAGAKPPLSGEPLTSQPSDKADSKVVEEESAGTGGYLQATNSTVISTTESTQAEMAVPVDLSAVGSVVELEAMGLDRLKRALIDRGMKCGGTLQERAARLFSVRGLANDQIDPALLAKATKTKKK